MIGVGSESSSHLAATSGDFVRIHPGSPGELTIDGVNSWHFVGVNLLWLSKQAATQGTVGKRRVDLALDKAVELGLGVVRTWGFDEENNDASAQHPRYGSSRHEGFAGIDYIVAEAGKRHLRLVLPLMNFGEGFGGLPEMQKWCIGGNYASNWKIGSSCPRFFSEPSCHELYLLHVKELTGRVNSITGRVYREDPTIMSWELCNACRCLMTDVQLQHFEEPPLQQFYRLMAPAVKEFVPSHLLATGSEGFYSGSSAAEAAQADARNPNEDGTGWYRHEGVTFLADHSLPSIDILSYHLVADEWLPYSTASAQRLFAAKWIRSHEDDAAVLSKPVYISMFSYEMPGQPRLRYFKAVFDAFARASNTSGLIFGQLSIATIGASDALLIDETGNAVNADTAAVLELAAAAAAAAKARDTVQPALASQLSSQSPADLPSPPLSSPPPQFTLASHSWPPCPPALAPPPQSTDASETPSLPLPPPLPTWLTALGAPKLRHLPPPLPHMPALPSVKGQAVLGFVRIRIMELDSGHILSFIVMPIFTLFMLCTVWRPEMYYLFLRLRRQWRRNIHRPIRRRLRLRAAVPTPPGLPQSSPSRGSATSRNTSTSHHVGLEHLIPQQTFLPAKVSAKSSTNPKRCYMELMHSCESPRRPDSPVGVPDAPVGHPYGATNSEEQTQMLNSNARGGARTPSNETVRCLRTRTPTPDFDTQIMSLQRTLQHTEISLRALLHTEPFVAENSLVTGDVQSQKDACGVTEVFLEEGEAPPHEIAASDTLKAAA